MSQSYEDPVFISLERALEAHLEYFGRDLECNEQRLDSAVNAAINAWQYEGETDLFELAAIYACRISQAHSFADGNKRTAHLVTMGFLNENGIDSSHFQEKDLVEWLVDVAKKTINQGQFARRLRCAAGFAAIAE